MMQQQIDPNSIVFTNEEPVAKTEVPGMNPQKLAPETIAPEIDASSVKFEESTTMKQSEISASPPQPSAWQRLSNSINPAHIAAQGPIALGHDFWREFGHDITKASPEQANAKAQNIYAMSQATGVPMSDINKHYSDLVRMSSVTGIQPETPTNKEMLGYIMSASLVPIAVASPIPTAATLLAYGALDKLVPTEQFIPDDASPGARDTIELVGMIVKGGLVGGLLDGGVPEVSKKFPSLPEITEFPTESLARIKNNTLEIFKSWTKEKLAEKGIPDTVKINPEQVEEIKNLDKPKEKVSESSNHEEMADELGKKVTEFKDKHGEPSPDEVARVGGRARTRAQNEFVQEISKGGTTGQPPGVPNPSIIESLGLKQSEIDAAIKNKLNVQIPAEKLLEMGLKDQDGFGRVHDILRPVESPSGETATSKVSKGVVEESLAKGFNDDFGDLLPQYQKANLKEQASLAEEFIKNNPDQAFQVAMGKASPPQGVIPEMIFNAVKSKAFAEKNIDAIKDLAHTKLASEATAMGQRIRALGERNPEDPVAAIQDVAKERTKRAEKRLKKGQTLEQEKAKAVKEIQQQIQKTIPKVKEWSDFVKSLEC